MGFFWPPPESWVRGEEGRSWGHPCRHNDASEQEQLSLPPVGVGGTAPCNSRLKDGNVWGFEKPLVSRGPALAHEEPLCAPVPLTCWGRHPMLPLGSRCWGSTQDAVQTAPPSTGPSSGKGCHPSVCQNPAGTW